MTLGYIKDDGTEIYVSRDDANDIYKNTFSNPCDFTTWTWTVTKSVSSQDGTPVWVYLNYNWTKLYMAWDANNTIYQYSL